VSKRIQLSRRKGWRKPEGAIVVSRPSKWGNPYKLSDYPSAMPMNQRSAHAIDCFRRLLLGQIAEPRVALPFTVEDVRSELAGKDLACWCRLSDACHADVLLAVANGTEP
jgi:hypothetical protein